MEEMVTGDSDACFGGACEDGGHVVAEFRDVEVGVSVGEHGRMMSRKSVGGARFFLPCLARKKNV
jgi:hypothetical protein